METDEGGRSEGRIGKLRSLRHLRIPWSQVHDSHHAKDSVKDHPSKAIKANLAAGGNVKLQDIGAVYARQHLAVALDSAKKGSPDLIARVQGLKLNAVPEDKRRELANSLYRSGKQALAKRDFNSALTSFRLAHKLAPGEPLFASRVKLLDPAIAERSAVPWQMSLMTLQHALGITCVKSHCTCTSHVEIARCRHLMGQGLQDRRGDVIIHTLATYYPRSPGDHWTRLLRTVKKKFQSELLEPMADIAADFLLELSGIMDSLDVIVPVPPSTEKFAHRGFAPNDLLARRISARLALPFKPVLLRKTGLATREATTEELSRQFEVRAADAHGIKGLSVLLVEDIWTWGRTIPICARTLIEAGARSVVAVALGKTGGR